MNKLCKNGHELTESTVYIRRDGYRQCKTCDKESAKRWYKKNSERILDKRRNEYFGGKWREVMERDGYKCVACGMTRDEHQMRWGRDITIDHIDGNGCGVPKDKRNNDLSNLQVLCMPCHQKKDHKYRKLTPEQIAQLPELNRTMSQVQIAKLFGVTQPAILYHINKPLGLGRFAKKFGVSDD